MWTAVLLFALIAATDPIRIGIAALLACRARPMLNLCVYWLGSMTIGVGAALVALFLVRDRLGAVVRAVTAAAQSPVVPPIQIVLGVVALPAAAMLLARWNRQPVALATTPSGNPSPMVPQPEMACPPEKSTTSSRFSWNAKLAGGSPWVAFVAGVFTSTPPVEYWGAVLVVMASRAAVPAQVGATVMFTLISSAIVEIPIVGCLAWPMRTQGYVLRLHDWMRCRRQPIFACVLALIGLSLVTKGVSCISL